MILLFSCEVLNAQWTLSYGSVDTRFDSIKINSAWKTIDQGIITAGYESGSNKVAGLLIIKYFSNGVIDWCRAYPGASSGVAIIQTADLGYAVCGDNREVIKLDFNGDIQWQKQIGDTGRIRSIRQTKDGGYILAGLTVPGTGQADDAWIVKLDGQGNCVWQRTYGGGDKDAFRAIEETADGGYLAVGFCSNITTYGKVDFWVVKTTSTGDLVWQRGYGGSDSERAYSFQPLADGGFIILGEGFKTTWIIRISASGEIVWQKKIETLITFDEGGDVADRLFGENSILAGSGQVTVVTPRRFNDVGGIPGFTCTGLAVLDLNESGEIIKQRNIIPQANLLGGVTLGKAALHKNGFGGYYIVSNPTGDGRPPWASIYVDNMCDGNYVTPDIASSDTDASGEPTHVASMPREFPISELHASPIVVTKTIAYTCGDVSLAEYSVSPAKLQFGASLPIGAGISANQTAP